MNAGEFAGKVTIVTGGANGIGRAIVTRLHAAGASVLIADRSRENGLATLHSFQQGKERVEFLEMDLGNLEDAERTVQVALDRFGRVDILVNSAAAHGELKPILETTPAEWEDVFRTNVLGTFTLTRAAVRQMLSQGGGGAVVNILAIQAFRPLPTYGPYSASKGALTTFTHSLAIELADKGIRVNGIAVGCVYTSSVMDALEVGTPERVSANVPEEINRSAATLVGRMGTPDDIARVAMFLASEDASFLAGAIIPADGGRLLSRKADPFVMAIEQQRPSVDNK